MEAGLCLLLVLCLWFVVDSASPAPISVMPWDCMIILEGGWRCFTGQVPHVDFVSPLGAIYPFITALGLVISGPSASAIFSGYHLVVVMITLLSLYLALDRFGLLGGLPFTVFVFFLMTAPTPLGYYSSELPLFLSYAMQYNRLGWGLFMIISVALLVRTRQPSSLRLASEGVILGMLISLLALIKPNYAIAECIMVGYAMVWIRPVRMLRVSMLLSILGCVLAYASIFRFDLAPVLSDYQLLSKVNAATVDLRLGYWGSTVYLSNAIYFISAAVSLLIATFFLLKNRHTGWQQSLHFLLALSLFILCGVFICLGNAQFYAIPGFTLFAGLFIGFFLRDKQLNMPRRWKAVCLIALIPCAVSGLRILYLDASHISVALEHNYSETAAEETMAINSSVATFRFLASAQDLAIDQSEVAIIDPEIWFREQLALEVLEGPRVMTPYQYIYYVNSGIEELRRSGALEGGPPPRILTVDFHNPFPLALGLPYPEHTVHWWDWLKVANLEHHPNPERMLSDVTHIMLPRVPTHLPDSKDYFATIKPYFENRIKSVHRGEFWIVLAL